jgi:hypothetical protein
MSRVLAACAILLLTRCTDEPGVSLPLATASDAPSATGSSTRRATEVRVGRIVYALPGYFGMGHGLRGYDVGSGIDRALEVEPADPAYPRFRPNGGITFVGGTSIFERARDGSVARVLSLPGVYEIRGPSWSRDGRRLAFISVTHAPRYRFDLWLWDAQRGADRVVRFLSRCERGTVIGDEFVTTWSPADKTVLVVNVCAPGSVRVLRPDGSSVIEPIDGTYARWSPDGASIYLRRFEDYPAAGDRWASVDVRTGLVEPLPIHRGAHRPAVSPDGRSIAYDTDRGVYVLDLATGVRRLVARDTMAPVWIGPGRIIVSGARDCVFGPSAAPDCPPHGWNRRAATGETFAVDVMSGRQHALSMRVTAVIPYASSLDVR